MHIYTAEHLGKKAIRHNSYIVCLGDGVRGIG